MFTIDAHLDLSMNALEWNRDLRRPVSEINEREKGLTDKEIGKELNCSTTAINNFRHSLNLPSIIKSTLFICV